MRLFRLLAFLFIVTITNDLFGQRLELTTSINSGLFYYGGQSATRSTVTDISYPPFYIKNPYGRNPDLSYGISVQLQKGTTNNLIYGLQIGYEVLSSKVNLHEVLSEEPVYAWDTSKSFITLSNNFVNFNPYIGHRIAKEKITIDLIAGSDFGFCINSQANIYVTNSRGDNAVVNTDMEKITLDIRPRVGANLFYKDFGLTLGYSLGLSNYSKTTNESDDRIFSRYLRVGLLYKIEL
jgi:hypothetical protein